MAAKMTLEEAREKYRIEREKRLRPDGIHQYPDLSGKYADFVILDRDIMTVPESEILNARVLATYVGGKSVYEAR